MNKYIALSITALILLLGYCTLSDSYAEKEYYLVEKRLVNVTLNNFKDMKRKIVEIKNLDEKAGGDGYVQITYRRSSSGR